MQAVGRPFCQPRIEDALLPTPAGSRKQTIVGRGQACCTVTERVVLLTILLDSCPGQPRHDPTP